MSKVSCGVDIPRRDDRVITHAQLISKARLMYCAGRSWFARSKDEVRRVRFDSGSQQKQRNNTEAEFLRKRKRDVQEVVIRDETFISDVWAK